MVMALVLLSPAIASVTGRAEGTAASDPIVSWLGLGIGGIILLTIAKVILFRCADAHSRAQGHTVASQRRGPDRLA